MAGLKELIAPFEPVRTFSSSNVRIEPPEVELDDASKKLWGYTGWTDQFPVIVAYEQKSISDSVELPLKSSIDQYELLSTCQAEYIPPETNVPLQSLILKSNGADILFEPFSEIQPYKADLFIVITPATEVYLPDNFFEDLTFPVNIEITDNLLKLIFPPEKVVGMNYASRYWEESRIYLPGFERRKQKAGTEKPVRPIHRGDLAKKQIGVSRQVPNFWDLVFVLLQPPLNLSIPENLALPSDLYPYQIKGVEFLLANEHALLADDMGTGKTVMTLVALKILIQQGVLKNVLILCPPSVLHEWRHHLEEWAPELVTTFVRGTKQIRAAIWDSPSHVYVTTYSTLRNDVHSGRLQSNYHSRFDLIVVDEAHHIKNPSTAQSRALRTLRPTRRWALTGTPVQNSLEDMIALFEFIYPGLLSQFDTEERVKKKISPHFLRRRKQEVMPELPPKVRQELELDLDRDQRRAYEQVERESLLEIEALGDRVTKQHIFAKITKLKQICNFAPGKNTSPKLEDLRERIEEIIASGHKVIVFSQYIAEGITKLEKGLKPYRFSKIVGGQSDSVRSLEIDRFKQSKDTGILLASVRSGGEGLNLAEASYVVHFDHWWNPAVMWQAEDRTHRRGQKYSVNIYSYWMMDTIDERIRTILDRKGLLFDNVVDGLADKDIEQLFDMNDWLEILGAKRVSPQKPTFEAHAWRGLSLEQIRRKLYDIKPYEFEDLVQQLMHYLGFPNVKVTKRSGDGGIDVISSRNTRKGVERIAAQCKRYKGTVGVRIAREFYGAIKDDPTIVNGLLITTGDFTTDCISFCTRNGIELIPGLKVAEYVKMFSLGTQAKIES